MERMRRLGVLLALSGGLLALSTQASLAQGDSSFDIRVEAREVVVPVYVTHRNAMITAPAHGNVGPTVSINVEFTGLVASDFHILEDGVEQPVRNLRVEQMHRWLVPDNMGEHLEYSGIPKGMWAGPEDWVPDPMLREDRKGKIVWGGNLHWYLVSYVPPPSAEGSCHRIKVTVGGPEATVYARDEYCNTQHSPSDPLKGTKVGERMEEEAASSQKAKLQLVAQAVPTFGSDSTGRANIAVEFPWSSLRTYLNGCFLEANVDLLGLVYNQDGTLATRFSDFAYSPTKALDYKGSVKVPGWGTVETTPDSCKEFSEEWRRFGLPNRYETQIDLPPGSYNLRIVVTDGEKFGRAEVPLTVGDHDRNSLAVSGIVLSKRFTNMAAAWLQHSHDYLRLVDKPEFDIYPRGETSTAPDYAPLVSNGIGLMPAGDTRFRKNGPGHKGDRMMTYFEVYEPLFAAGEAKVQFQIRVVDAKTGRVELNSGLRSAESYAHSGNLIPIGWEIPVDKLAKGAYRVEVQASDSAGEQTAWRTASFTVE